MSNYFRTLLRFEKARAASRHHQEDDATVDPRQTSVPERPADDDHRRPPGELPSPPDTWQDFRTPLLPPARQQRRRSTGHRPRPSLLGRLGSLVRRKTHEVESAQSLLAYGQLLDSLRAVDTRYSSPGVVLASAGGYASARQVVDGLVRQARSMGVRIALAELVLEGDERVLRSRDDDGSLPTATKLELTGAGSDQILRDWFERATAGHDLLIVEGPPLTQSVDAALLARAGDGLAIVLEPRVTTREELETAIERARASGCFALGLVMSHHQHWLPRFLRGFFSSYPKSIRTRARRG